ncbi:MAG: PASTA domain-containing protein [Acidimicrobiia bacterium]
MSVLGEEQVGRVLGGRYRLLASLGIGASARVYLADDVRLDRRVAVKVLQPALAADPTFIRRFKAEAQFVAKLSHQNVLQVFDWGEEGHDYFLVTEFLGGGSLRSMLDRGTLLTPSQALLVGLEVARGLDYAHRQGLVHRDIKPANLLFDVDGRLRIADFGIARAMAEAAWTEPAGVVLGTARYASPEQARSLPIDGRSDVYSLALVMVEAVTGKVPFAADTTVATLMGRVDRLMPVSADLGPLAPVVERAGRPDPAERYDAAELARALIGAAERLPRPAPLPLVLTDIPGVPHDQTILAAPSTPASVQATPEFIGDGDDITIAGPVAAAVVAGTNPNAGTTPNADAKPAAKPERKHAAAKPKRTAAPAPKRRRRWSRVLAVVLVLALVGAGAAGVYLRQQDKTVTYTLPKLVGITQAAAENALSDFDVRIEIERTRADGTKPGDVVAQVPPEGTIKQGETITLTVSDGAPLVIVPDLAGKTQPDVEAMLTQLGLLLGKVTTQNDETAPPTTVMDWSLKSMTVPKGTAVDLLVSSGPAPRTLPDLAKKTFEDATAALAAIQLKIVRDPDAFSDTIPAGQVISMAPAPATQVPRDSEVHVIVSKGPDLVKVPDVGGLTLDQAVKALQDGGVTPGDVSGKANKKVAVTDPRAGTSVKRGSRVDIVLG